MPDGFLSIAEIINKEPGLKRLRKVIKQNDVMEGFHKIFPDLKKIAIPIKIDLIFSSILPTLCIPSEIIPWILLSRSIL